MTPTPEEIEAIARALCYNRSGPACDCRDRGIPCRASLESLMWEHGEISRQSLAAWHAARPGIRRGALREAKKVAEMAPYKKGGIVCGCSEGLSNWTAAAIEALMEKQ